MIQPEFLFDGATLTVIENGTTAILTELGSDARWAAADRMSTSEDAADFRAVILVPEPRVSAIEPVLSSTMATSILLIERTTSEWAARVMVAPNSEVSTGWMVAEASATMVLLLATKFCGDETRVMPPLALSCERRMETPRVFIWVASVRVERATARAAESSESCRLCRADEARL